MPYAEEVAAILNTGASHLDSAVVAIQRATTTHDSFRTEINLVLRLIDRLMREVLTAIKEMRDGNGPISHASVGTGNQVVSDALAKMQVAEESLVEDLRSLQQLKQDLENILRASGTNLSETSGTIRESATTFRVYAGIL